MPFNVGETVGPYRIVEQLGQGGMATVFKAYHASLDRYVAIKALHPAFSRDVTFESRFQREARVVAKLEHPNIVPVYDYAEHEGRPYLVMKFIEGITLKARMDDGPLSSDEVLKIADAVGAALSYAHKQGVLHRDIKPSNVLVANDGQIYLADFGLARMAQSGESTLSSDMIMGTPQYISPEQAMGKPDLDQRTDLYSFGVMLYEMVVGKVPYNADTPFSIIHDHIFSPLPLPRTVNPNVTEPVERVLLKALAKERDDRFEDASQLLKAFKNALNADVPAQSAEVNMAPAMDQGAKTVEQAVPTKVASVSAPPLSVEEKPKEAVAGPKSEKKRSPWMWVSIGLLVILCLGGLFVFRNIRNARLLARQAPTQLPGGPGPNNPNPPADAPPQQGLPPLSDQVPQTGPRPNVADAETFAREHPDDLDAQLNLAIAYWDAGMPRQTFDALGRINELAGPDNAEFYQRAGNDLRAHEAWLPAASMFFQTLKTFEGRPAPQKLIDDFHESLYKGADRPETQLTVPLENLMRMDEPMALVALARNNFYNGKIDEAHGRLEDALRLVPDMFEARLLQAEFSVEESRFDDARRELDALLSGPTMPPWIRNFAEELLKRIPK